MGILERRVLHIGQSECKGPGADVCLGHSRRSRTVRLEDGGRVAGGEDRETTGTLHSESPGWGQGRVLSRRGTGSHLHFLRLILSPLETRL